MRSVAGFSPSTDSAWKEEVCSGRLLARLALESKVQGRGANPLWTFGPRTLDGPPPRSFQVFRSSIGGRWAPRNGLRSGGIGMRGKRSSVAPAPGASTWAPTGRMWDTAACDSMWEASKRPPSHARGVRAECGRTSSIAPDGAGSAVPGNQIIVGGVPGSSECCYTVGNASDQAAIQITHKNQIPANPITIGGHLNRMESLPNSVGPTVPLSLRTRAFDGMLSLGRAREKDSWSGPPTPGAFPTVSRPMTPWGQDQAPAKLLSHGPLRKTGRDSGLLPPLLPLLVPGHLNSFELLFVG